MVQAFVALLVPLQMPNDLLFFGQNFAQTNDVVAVVMVTLVFHRASIVSAFQVA